MSRDDGTDAEVTVVVPDEPPALTPLAAVALLRMIRDTERRRDGTDGRVPPAELSPVDQPKGERKPG